MLGYDYDTRRAVLTLPAPGELSPHLYALCGHCADRLRPPRGWELVDERPIRPAAARASVDMERDRALAGATDVLSAR